MAVFKIYQFKINIISFGKKHLSRVTIFVPRNLCQTSTKIFVFLNSFGILDECDT